MATVIVAEAKDRAIKGLEELLRLGASLPRSVDEVLAAVKALPAFLDNGAPDPEPPLGARSDLFDID